MLKKLSEEEEILFECLCMPRSYIEIIFSNLDNLMEFEGDHLSWVRSYQETMLSYEYSVADDPEQLDEDNFERKRNAGEAYGIASRTLGKSLIFLTCDMLQDAMVSQGKDTAMASYDANHVRKIIASDFMSVIEFHPCYRGIKKTFQQTPQFLYVGKNGFVLHGVNENAINQRKAGENWIGLHPKKIWYEEVSRWCYTAREKQIEAVAETGAILRASGMSDCTRNSPAGEIVYNKRNKNRLINYPRFVNPTWNAKKRQEALLKYKSESSFGWKVYILGQMVEDGYAALDMKLISMCYDEHHEIKAFELTKKNFEYYKDLIIVDKPKDAEVTYIASDVSDIGTTEIIIVFDTPTILKYRYNITLNGLTDEQIYVVEKWLAEKLQANVIANDEGEATGRSINRRLLKDFQPENIFGYAGTKKIVVDFERYQTRSGETRIKFDTHGNPIVKEEFMREWAFQVIKDVFYGKKIDIPLDYKLDEQLSKTVVTKSGNRTIYACSGEDHLLDAFIVFLCAWWQNHLSTIVPIKKKKFCKVGVSSLK